MHGHSLALFTIIVQKNKATKNVIEQFSERLIEQIIHFLKFHVKNFKVSSPCRVKGHP